MFNTPTLTPISSSDPASEATDVIAIQKCWVQISGKKAHGVVYTLSSHCIIVTITID